MTPSEPVVRHIDAGVLDVAFSESGPANGRPVVLLHGFPYDAHAYDEVVPLLVAAGRRVIVPYLRGYGPTGFLSLRYAAIGTAGRARPRSARADRSARSRSSSAGRIRLGWSGGVHRGRAVARTRARSRDVRWLQRVGCRGLVASPAPEVEHALWYQYYFHGERGRAGLAQHRYEYCKLLWHLWSPKWDFDDATYAQTAASFDNPDFVDVVIHSYRHRFGLVPGDPAVEETEARLADAAHDRRAHDLAARRRQRRLAGGELTNATGICSRATSSAM